MISSFAWSTGSVPVRRSTVSPCVGRRPFCCKKWESLWDELCYIIRAFMKAFKLSYTARHEKYAINFREGLRSQHCQLYVLDKMLEVHYVPLHSHCNYLARGCPSVLALASGPLTPVLSVDMVKLLLSVTILYRMNLTRYIREYVNHSSVSHK